MAALAVLLLPLLGAGISSSCLIFVLPHGNTHSRGENHIPEGETTFQRAWQPRKWKFPGAIGKCAVCRLEGSVRSGQQQRERDGAGEGICRAEGMEQSSGRKQEFGRRNNPKSWDVIPGEAAGTLCQGGNSRGSKQGANGRGDVGQD